MKKIIIWLAKISGADKQIKQEARVEIANSIPISRLKNHPKAYNFCLMFSDDLRRGCDPSDIEFLGPKYANRLIIFGKNLILHEKLQTCTNKK